MVVEKMKGSPPKELQDLLEIPESFKVVWQWFLRLNSKRQAGMGISPITYTEIMSFFQLIGIKPEIWEIEMIESFDKIALEAYEQSK